MLVVCVGCKSRLGWNPKRDKRLRELSCPHCGAHYRKALLEPAEADPLAEARLIAVRMESAAERVEAALAGVRDLGPCLAELGAVLGAAREYAPPRLLKGGAA